MPGSLSIDELRLTMSESYFYIKEPKIFVLTMESLHRPARSQGISTDEPDALKSL